MSKENHQSTIESNMMRKLDFNHLLKSIVRLKTEDREGVGFIISKEGHILTNAHILEGNLFCYGNLHQDNHLIKFHLIDFEDFEQADICILKAEEVKEYIPLEFSKEPLNVGQTVFTIGNPRNLGMSLSKGFVSQIKSDHIQLDMTLNPGNSGGPVFDEQGYVVGMISYLLKDVQGLGFAVSLESIHRYVDRLGLFQDKLFLSSTTLQKPLVIDHSFYESIKDINHKLIHIIKRPIYRIIIGVTLLILTSLVIVLTMVNSVSFVYQGEVIKKITGFTGYDISNVLPEINAQGQIFEGWYLDEALTEKYHAFEIQKSDIVLYPKFVDVDKSYAIHFETNGGLAMDSKYTHDLLKADLPNPLKEDFIFTEWFLDEDLTQKVNDDILLSDVTLYAGWILDIYDFTENDSHITIDLYRGDQLYIEIPSIILQKPVTEIGSRAFERVNATEITIPDTVEVIYDSAFNQMMNVRRIHISPNSKLHTIHNLAFQMGKESFVKELYIPPLVGFIGDFYSFSENFEAYNVDSNNAYYASLNGVLYDHSMTKLISYPSGKKDINYEVIESVKTFGNHPFFENVFMEILSFHPDSMLTMLPQHTFENMTSLSSITLPPKLEIIDPYFSSYQGFKSLDEIIISEDNLYFRTEDNILYDKDMTAIYLVASQNTGVFYIPNTIESIKSYAFNNSHLFDIYIPSSVIDIMYDAFKGAINISNYSVDLENPMYMDLDGVLFSKDLLKLIAFPPDRTGTYIIPKEVKTIGENAFYYTRLEIVRFEEGSQAFSIEYHAFTSSNLKEVYIPKSVMIVSYLAFAMYPGMDIYVEHNEKPSGWHEGWTVSVNTVTWGYENIYG